MRRTVVILALIFALLGAGLAGVYFWQRPMLLTGSGYACLLYTSRCV